jgi:uncharacterized protein (DUF2141 family)
MMLVAAISPPESTLEIVVSGLRSKKGNVLLCLTANPATFPDCGKDPNARKIKYPAGSSGNPRFLNLVPGNYVMTLLHDENANGKMDLTFGLPREGFGFSNVSQTVNIKYVF